MVVLSVVLIFRCLIGALCNFTAKTRLGSCINAFAYWSSVTQSNIKKLNFTVLMEASDLVSCMTMEQYSRKVTRRLLGVPEIISSMLMPLWEPLGVVGFGPHQWQLEFYQRCSKCSQFGNVQEWQWNFGSNVRPHIRPTRTRCRLSIVIEIGRGPRPIRTCFRPYLWMNSTIQNVADLTMNFRTGCCKLPSIW